MLKCPRFLRFSSKIFSSRKKEPSLPPKDPDSSPAESRPPGFPRLQEVAIPINQAVFKALMNAFISARRLRGLERKLFRRNFRKQFKKRDIPKLFEKFRRQYPAVDLPTLLRDGQN